MDEKTCQNVAYRLKNFFKAGVLILMQRNEDVTQSWYLPVEH